MESLGALRRRIGITIVGRRARSGARHGSETSGMAFEAIEARLRVSRPRAIVIASLSGLVGVRRRTFLWTTAVGIVPGAIAFTASGTGLAGLHVRHPRTSIALGSIVVVLVALLARRRRSRSGS